MKHLILLLLFSPLSGYEYTHLLLESSHSVHILKVTEDEELIPVKANGRETVSHMAHNRSARAGINGGFFKTDGSPTGALRIEGEWVGEGELPRGVCAWDDQQMAFGRFERKNDWESFPNMVQGVPLLIHNGKPVWDYTPERITNPNFPSGHSRTAIGQTAGGIILVVVDSKMTLIELTLLMLSQGCSEALNLDGGGSSTMVIDGRVVNQPSGGEGEREVGDAILLHSKVTSL